MRNAAPKVIEAGIPLLHQLLNTLPKELTVLLLELHQPGLNICIWPKSTVLQHFLEV
jgi:hypothetical protein